MSNKLKQKQLKSLVILFLLIIVMVAIGLFLQINDKNKIDTSSNILSENEICDPYLTIVDSADMGNTQNCDCLKDENEKKYCEDVTLSLINYKKGIENSDLELCRKITDLNMQKSCINIVEGKKNYSKNNFSEND